MKDELNGIVNLQEVPGKVAGNRRPPTDTLAVRCGDRIEDAREWQCLFGTPRIPKGVYRFRTHEEADEWLWQMLTHRRTSY